MAERRTRALAGVGGSRVGGLSGWLVAAELTDEDLRQARTMLTVAGILALITGAVSILVPAVASVTISLFIGWVMVAGGIVMAIPAVSDRVARRTLEALLTLIAGLYLVSFPLNGTVTLTFVLSVWLFAAGVLQLLAATRTGRRPEGWAGAIGGVLSILLGFLIADSLPSSAAWAIGLLVGINLMFWGVRALIGARLLTPVEPRR
jgi:uncharacterized membrane protein HdeD (DUF308 family)